jgi:hypothetical protein
LHNGKTELRPRPEDHETSPPAAAIALDDLWQRGGDRGGRVVLITGAHSIIYSTRPEADRAFLRDVLKLTHVDVGGGWLIFGLPPAEVAVHPSDENDVHEFYLMCDDVEALVAALKEHNVGCGPVQNQGWGLLTHVTLPGGGRLGIYQPRHARPRTMKMAKPAKRVSKRRAKPRKQSRPSAKGTGTARRRSPSR